MPAEPSDPPLISVIIPTLNEESQIAETIASVRGTIPCEIIVVDGKSTDNTLKQATAADQILTSAPGRAKQQNRGADASRGKILLFLHADCRLQPGCLPAIQSCLSQSPSPLAGCFHQQIDAPGILFRCLERGNAFRVWFSGWAYGDQGIFIHRQLFEELGQFPEIPLMEDLVLMKQLKRRRLRPHLLKARITLSARRWQQAGIFRQTLRNWFFVLLFHLGVSPQKLRQYYPNIR